MQHILHLKDLVVSQTTRVDTSKMNSNQKVIQHLITIMRKMLVKLVVANGMKKTRHVKSLMIKKEKLVKPMVVNGILKLVHVKKKKKKKMTVAKAREIFKEEELEKCLDMDIIVDKAIEATEESGIVFIDEFDKIAEKGHANGPDVSREGVQRDILPIVEGATVNTKYGPVKTDHILFIAAGAFHVSKPSDLIPELQGRFPIRIELQSLTVDDFRRILTEPNQSLVKQYKALLETDGVTLEFTDDGIDAIAEYAYRVNLETENIGARRLHTILEKILEDVAYEAPDIDEKHIVVNKEFVSGKLNDVVQNVDLSHYIL